MTYISQQIPTSMARSWPPHQPCRPSRNTVLVVLSTLSSCSLLLLLLFLLLPSPTSAATRENEEKQIRKEENVFHATNEWQPIPRDASVPPGLHVKLDLSTGERLGKLLDADETAQAAATGAAGTAVSTSSTFIPPNQNKSQNGGGLLDSITIKNTPEEALDTASGPLPTRRETMLKVISNLPPVERASMGVDALLATRPPDLSHPEEEEVFWQKVEGLWEERQAMLQQAYDNMLKPAEELGRLIQVLREGAGEEGLLLQALIELEDWLSDVDMAQDFYTLGGWPLLVGRLGRGGGKEVRWRAAWAVGNAVKNDRGFQGWVLERGKEGEGDSALTLLVEILREAAEGGVEGEEREHGEELLRKTVYALTSAARGNALVQSQLLKEGGLEVMGRLLASSPSSSSSSSGRRALRLKLVAFAHDMILEARQGQEATWEVEEARHPPSPPPSLHASLLEGVTTPTWCQGALVLLEEVAREGGKGGGSTGAQAVETEKVVEALGLLHGGCSGHGHWGGREVVGRVVRRAREEVGREMWAEGVNPEYHQELLGMLEELAREVEGERGGEAGRERVEL